MDVTRLIQWALPVVVGFASAGCGSSIADDVAPEDADPNALTWISPTEAQVEAAEPVVLSLTTSNPAARAVRFDVDGREVGVCDATAPDQDCHAADLWRFTTTFATPGRHTLHAWFAGADGLRVEASREIEVVEAPTLGEAPMEPPMEPAMEPMMERPVEMVPEDTMPPAMPRPRVTAHAGFRDPDRAFHSVFGGIAWEVNHNRTLLRSGAPMGSVTAVSQCMHRYGTAIRRFADRYRISRASVVATAITESNCSNPRGSSDGLSSGPMQVTASTCAAVTGRSSSYCRSQMHRDPGYSFEVGVRYMASSYQRNQHRNDPPRIAAAYNAGSVRRSSRNRWHMLVTGNHIDRFVQAYNAYHRWESSSHGAIEILGPERTFEGQHVATAAELPASAGEGTTVFVGDWSNRDGQFYEFENGRWWSTAE